ncbi:hypothetical protein [Arthrobacter sp. ISL-95]|uniref:hypothetical protein n=1 Tax=Arthrobacter sp. ISL-95 TaxID=2819116 RepID=UPI001BEB9F0D|nr:hypothetical protein [Arthrobacter sp. ISL-95]MBT2587913.1 hypothetical protein [Arthrobacter sp. ISL-95]
MREGLTGGDHVKWTLPNGRTYFTGLTPSDTRVLKNIKAETRRMLGLASDGTKAAKYSKATETSGFSIEAARAEQRRNTAIRQVIGRCNANILRIDAQLTIAQRNRDQREGERLVAQYMSNKETLERYHQPVPALTCKSQAAMAVAA